MKRYNNQEKVSPVGLLKRIGSLSLLPSFLSDEEVEKNRKAKVVFLILVTVAYFVFPLDFLADFLFFGLGYIEDIAVAYFMLGKVSDELERYRNEKTGEGRTENIIEAEFREK